MMASLPRTIRTVTRVARQSTLPSTSTLSRYQCLTQPRALAQSGRYLASASSTSLRMFSTTSPSMVADRDKEAMDKFLAEYNASDGIPEPIKPYIPDPPDGLEDDDNYDPDIPEWNNDDVSSIAHGEIEQHREFREYARLAMWEMPKLAQFAKKFEPPNSKQLLRFRYTSYMGVKHPAENKVVMEVDTRKLHFLTEAQRLTLYKLVGQRYNPTIRIIKFSCEMFEQQAQNKRYLSDLFDTLLHEVQHGKDDFADIPLDLRHHKPKKELKFPKEWLMTPSRLLEKRKKDWRSAPQEVRDEMLQTVSEYTGKQATI